MSAEISSCGTYRYLLTRELSDEREKRRCLFVMLNPSTADATNDDPTIRRCIGFAKRFDCNVLEVVNLFAYRASKPRDLWKARKDGVDITGGWRNVSHTRSAVGRAEMIIAGWGAIKRESYGWSLCRPLDLAQKCAFSLGETKNRSPRHPLFVKKVAPLSVWHRPRFVEVPEIRDTLSPSPEAKAMKSGERKETES